MKGTYQEYRKIITGKSNIIMSSLLQNPPPLTKPANGALPFNKMFIMIPVMLAARNLKNDDLNTVYMIRVAYVVVQSICLLLAIYTYIMVSSIQGGSTTALTSINRIIYVPAPPQVSKLWSVPKNSINIFASSSFFSYFLLFSYAINKFFFLV